MSVLAGIWMGSAEDAEILERALEARLRDLPVQHPDRAKLEEWRAQVLNMTHRAGRERWGSEWEIPA